MCFLYFSGYHKNKTNLNPGGAFQQRQSVLSCNVPRGFNDVGQHTELPIHSLLFWCLYNMLPNILVLLFVLYCWENISFCFNAIKIKLKTKTTGYLKPTLPFPFLHQEVLTFIHHNCNLHVYTAGLQLN